MPEKYRSELLTEAEQQMLDARIRNMVAVAAKHLRTATLEAGLAHESRLEHTEQEGKGGHKSMAGFVVRDICTGEAVCVRVALYREKRYPGVGRVFLAYECTSEFNEILIRWDFRKDIVANRELVHQGPDGKEVPMHLFDSQHLMLERLDVLAASDSPLNFSKVSDQFTAAVIKHLED